MRKNRKAENRRDWTGIRWEGNTLGVFWENVRSMKSGKKVPSYQRGKGLMMMQKGMILRIGMILLLGVLLLSSGIHGYAMTTDFSGSSTEFDDRDFRLAGDNRYQTAGEIAMKNGGKSDRVIIVRGDSVDGVPQVVDGLTASALAGAKNAEILMVSQNRIPDATKETMKTLGAREALIIGGKAAVSESVEAELKVMGLSVKRIEGSNRYETAAEVAGEIGMARENTAIIVNGTSEVDSLVAGPLAHQGYPILMVNNGQGTIPDATSQALEDLHIEKLMIVGGTGVVSEDLEEALKELPGIREVQRFGGDNRVQTSIALSTHEGFHGITTVSLVNGGEYVDAVAASTLGAPVIYFMERSGITRELEDLLEEQSMLHAIGGRAVITNSILEQATLVIGFEYYGELHRRSPNILRFKNAFTRHGMNLLTRAQTLHSEGDFDKAEEHYQRILRERDLLPGRIGDAAENSMEAAVRQVKIQSPENALEEALNITSVTSKYNAFIEGIPLYGGNPRYLQGLMDAGKDLMEWALNRHQQKNFDDALSRYALIIQSSEGISELSPLTGEARFYQDLAERRLTWNRDQMKLRFIRYRDSLGDVLETQIQNNSHTVRNGSSWVTPERESVEHYLNSRNFYEANWQEVNHPIKYVQIASSSLRMRSGPSTSYDIIDMTYRDEIYPVLGESEGWFQIRKDGRTGWVGASFVHRIGEDTGVSNIRLRVTASALNVRTGPSTSYDRIGQVTSGEVFLLQEHQGGWHKIHYHGMEGWVSGDFTEILDDVPASTFQFLVLSGTVPARASEINQLIGNDPYLQGTASLFRQAGRDNGINEIYLVTHALMESEGVSHNLVEGIRVTEVNGRSVTPRTVFNVYGIGATGKDPVKSGAEFAYEKGWTTREAAILEGAKWIADEFIHRSVTPQDTLYKMRWNPGSEGENPYTSDIQWAEALGGRLAESYRQLDLDSVNFDISVYKTRAWPVPGYTRISSPYGYRIHPIRGTLQMHIGIDIPAPGGTPIVAAKSGRVTVSRFGESYGNWVEIDHGHGITTRYAHNSKNLVKVGDWVNKGETIALVGTTGSSTGNHLHFEVRHNNHHFNPLSWLQGH